MESVLSSYLISIGFEPDNSSYRKFTGALNQAEHAVASSTGGIARKVLEVQGAITGAFLGVSAAILGVVDKTAMADQSYRLMGLRMQMSQDQARKLSIITKTLGASLEEIIWDPELHQRANLMSAHIDRMTAMMGPGFERDMRSIRDVRAEFGMLGMDIEFLGMKFASDLWQKVAPGDPAKQLNQWIGDFERKIPEVSGELSRLASGALTDTWHILQETRGAAKEGALAFTNLIGALSGDKAIESTTFSFSNLAKAMEHVEHGAVAVVDSIVKSESALAELASSATLAVSGKQKEASSEFEKARKNITPGSGAVIGGMSGAAVGSLVGGALGIPLGPLGVIPGALLGSVVGGAIGGAGGAAVGEAAKETNGQTDAQKAFMAAKPYGDDALSLVRGLGIAEAIKVAAGEAIQEGYDWLYGKAKPALTPGALNQVQSVQPGLPEGSIAQPAPSALTGGEIVTPSEPTANSLVDRLAAAITKFESGSKEDSIAVRNNNPGNLRTWGDYPISGGYAKFPDWETGMAALRKQIELNIGRGLSLNEFFAGKENSYYGFAPKKDRNDPEAYAAAMAKALGGVDVNTPLNQIVLPPAATAAPSPSIAAPTPNVPATTDVPIARPIAYTVPADQGASLVHPLWMSAPSLFPSDADSRLAAAFAAMQRPVSLTHDAPSAPQTFTMGDINVYVTQPGASADDIERAVRRGVSQEFGRQTQFDLSQLRAAY